MITKSFYVQFNRKYNNGHDHKLLCTDYEPLVCVADGRDHLDRHDDPREVHPLQPDTPGQSVELLPAFTVSSPAWPASPPSSRTSPSWPTRMPPLAVSDL